ncbi:ubiquitin thioesterase OTUB2 isoform X2 [Pseudophryne corroboree]|uniref:ubiquitin thioesterase OTUB2 isoform X2 n=1 Tax=Pseudophryne corroboree TaxID=495146 RepID=UPI00308182BB
MADWEPPRYELQLDVRRRNVFVTQLGEGREEEDENITQIPIIKEAAGKILDTSKNTLQKTLVLKKEVEYDRVSQELVDKRQEFAERMRVLDALKEQFALKQRECSDKAVKFEKFLKDSDAKRNRAIVKCQAESRQNELRQVEFDELTKQLGEKRIRQQNLHVRIKKNKIYEEFLLKMVEKVPDNYLEYGMDTPMKAIIRRYETLSFTNANLVNNLTVLADELESAQHRLELLKRQHDTSKLTESSCDLVSEKCDIESFIEEYAGEPLYQRKLKDLQATYGAVRKMRADGSCFYRGLGFAYLESLLGKQQEILRFRERLIQSRHELLAAGFLEHLFQYCYEIHVEPMSTVCDHIQIIALTQALDIPLQVEYVNSMDTAVNHHVFPEGASPTIYMLYTQDHYSLLYRAQSQEEK